MSLFCLHSEVGDVLEADPKRKLGRKKSVTEHTLNAALLKGTQWSIAMA